MKKNFLLLILALSLLLTACGGGNTEKEKAENEENESTEQVEIDDNIEIYGVVKSGEERVLNLPAAVKIKDVLVQTGQVAKAGETLFTVDVDALNEEIAHIKSQIRSVQSSTPSGNSSYNRANNNAEQIRAEVKRAQDKVNQMKPLYDAGAISATEFQTYQDNLSKLKSSLQTAIYDIDGVTENNAERQQASEKQIEDLQYQLKKIEDALASDVFENDKVVLTDGDAIIGKVMALKGAYLPANQEIMRLIAYSDNSVVAASLPEEYYSKVKLGQEAEIKSLVLGDEVLKGKISFISQIAESQGTEMVFPIEVELADGQKLPPNSNVDVSIIVK